jgi:hypothetical protein
MIRPKRDWNQFFPFWDKEMVGQENDEDRDEFGGTTK